MKNYPFTLDIKFLPYLINEDLGDKQAISKAELFESKFIGVYSDQPLVGAIPHHNTIVFQAVTTLRPCARRFQRKEKRRASNSLGIQSVEPKHFDWAVFTEHLRLFKGAKVRQTRRAHRIIEKAYEVGSFELQARIAERLYSVSLATLPCISHSPLMPLLGVSRRIYRCR